MASTRMFLCKRWAFSYPIKYIPGSSTTKCTRSGIWTLSKSFQSSTELHLQNIQCHRLKSSWTNYAPKRKPNSENKSQAKKPSRVSIQGIFTNDKDNLTKEKTAGISSLEIPQEYSQSVDDLSENDDDQIKSRRSFNAMDELYKKVAAEKCRYIALEEWDECNRFIEENAKELSRSWSVRLADYISLQKKDDGILELGESILEYIKEKSSRMTPLLTDVIRMQLFLNQCCGEEHILKIYDDLCNKYKFLDASSLSKIIPVLCRTSRWRECIELLDTFSLTAKPSTLQYSPIIAAAVRNNDKTTGYQLMDVMAAKELSPNNEVYKEFLNSADSMDDINELLLLIREKEWFVSETIAQDIQTWFEGQTGPLKWKGERVQVKKIPKCPMCGEMLEPITPLSTEIFEELKDKFLEKSLLKKDIFQNTSPDELDAFTGMLERHGPFDIVIDGLNTAHGTVQKASTKVKAEVLHHVVHHFSELKGKKVLMLGRVHMKSWPQQFMSPIRKKAHCFFTTDSSEDDPFMLYAALSSGPHTLFVTRDQLRDHRTLLGDRLARSFKHWQLSRQVPFLGRYPDRHRNMYLSFKWPNTYHSRVHQTAKGWHIPYDDGQQRASYDVPNTWLCLVNTPAT